MSANAAAPWRRVLPNGKAVSALGFGCSSIWAKPAFADGDAHAIVSALADGGLNMFDTAPLYGAGCGERRLGRLIAERGADRLVIATKVGHNLVGGKPVRSFDPAIMEQSLQASLRRLGTQQVDFLFLHGPGVGDLNHEVLSWLEGVKRSGRASYSGVNSFDNAVLDRCADLPVDSVMLQYSAADFRNGVALKRLLGAGKMVLSGTAMGRAVFDPQRFLPSDRARLWYLLRLIRKDPAAILRAAPLRRVLTRFDSDPYSAAIRFMASHPGILTSLFGTASLAHAQANVASAQRALAPGEWRAMAKALGSPLGGGG